MTFSSLCCYVGWARSIWCWCNGRWRGGVCWHAVWQCCWHGQCIWRRLQESGLCQSSKCSPSVDMWPGVNREMDMCRSAEMQYVCFYHACTCVALLCAQCACPSFYACSTIHPCDVLVYKVWTYINSKAHRDLTKRRSYVLASVQQACGATFQYAVS